MNNNQVKSDPSGLDRDGWWLVWVVCFWLTFPASAAFGQFSEKVINQGKSFTVRVANLNGGGDIEGTGSGFVISKRGHFATNFHVVEGAEGLLVIFASGNRIFVYPAKLVATDPDSDLAIIQTPERVPGTAVATLAIAEPSSGQDVMSIGFPGVLDILEFSGNSQIDQISEHEFKADKAAISRATPATFPGNVGKGSGSHIAHSATISGGNSGGPLIDLNGRVVGVNTFVPQPELTSIDYAFSVPAARLATLAKSKGINISASSSHASLPGQMGALPILLIVAIAGLSVLTFLMVLRKPRTVLVEGLSRVVGSLRHHEKREPPATFRERPAVENLPSSAPPAKSSTGSRMTLRGRDQEGRSFNLVFDTDTFRRAGGRLYLGRNRELCQLHLAQDSISRQHAALVLEGETVYVEDRNSGNGTFVNGREVLLGAPPVALNSGGRIKVGEVELVFDILS